MLSQNRRFLTPSPLQVFFLLSKIGNFLPLPPLDDIVYGLPLRGVQQLRWPDFFLFWKPFHQDMDIFNPESGQKLSFLDHLSTSSCPRSYWMITWWNNQLLRQWKAVRLFYTSSKWQIGIDVKLVYGFLYENFVLHFGMISQ